MPETHPDNDASRIDFQQIRKDLESESTKLMLKDVRQADIAALFKKKQSSHSQTEKPQ